MSKLIIKYISYSFIIGFLISCSSTSEFSKYENAKGILIETGVASWYGYEFDGNRTANGEIFNTYNFTAAHRTLPFNSIVRVVNKSNGKSVIVRINDRGPFVKNRIIDLSKKAAEEIAMIQPGSAVVEIWLLNSNSPIPKNLKTSHYTIQVGSYKNRRDAQTISSKIENSRVVKANVDGVIYYRIYVGKFTNQQQAKGYQEILEDKGIDGFVKQVEN